MKKLLGPIALGIAVLFALGLVGLKFAGCNPAADLKAARQAQAEVAAKVQGTPAPDLSSILNCGPDESPTMVTVGGVTAVVCKTDETKRGNNAMFAVKDELKGLKDQLTKMVECDQKSGRCGETSNLAPRQRNPRPPRRPAPPSNDLNVNVDAALYSACDNTRIGEDCSVTFTVR